MSLPFVKTVREFETLASTSDTARELVEAGGIELPLLVIARHQTAGRGRGDHVWWSGEGSLTFTLAIDPEMHGLGPEHEPRVALAVAVTLCEVIEGVSDKGARIRWPNDVECDGRKIAGILPERLETAEGPRLLIGVGVNLDNRFEDAPPEIRTLATSIALEGWSYDEKCEPGEFLGVILANLPDIFDQLAKDSTSLSDKWRYRDLLVGRYVRLQVDDHVVTGIGAGIASDGGLILRTFENGVQTYYGGQVLRDPQ
jgi:BirA family biotin operon repressor/biotin-[acetyl-CoA-carboxylase] ligase